MLLTVEPAVHTGQWAEQSPACLWTGMVCGLVPELKHRGRKLVERKGICCPVLLFWATYRGFMTLDCAEGEGPGKILRSIKKWEKKREKIKIQVHSSFYSCSLLSAPWCEPLATGEISKEHSAGCWFSGALLQGQEVARKASSLTHLLEPCISLTQSSSRLLISITKSNVFIYRI